VDREPFADTAHRLAAYHAVGYLGGLSITVEVGGDWSRFASAPAFMAFTGLVPSERSSGGTRRQGSVTKTGNVVVRTQLIESAWHYRHNSGPGRPLRERQSHVGPDTVARATVAHRRLCARYHRLAARGKNPKLVTTAVARELAGFLWAEMTS
jgi:transposase